jgi:hypothetical protein
MHEGQIASREYSTYLFRFRDKGLGRCRQPATARPDSRRSTCRISKPTSEDGADMDPKTACRWRSESAAACIPLRDRVHHLDRHGLCLFVFLLFGESPLLVVVSYSSWSAIGGLGCCGGGDEIRGPSRGCTMARSAAARDRKLEQKLRQQESNLRNCTRRETYQGSGGKAMTVPLCMGDDCLSGFRVLKAVSHGPQAWSVTNSFAGQQLQSFWRVVIRYL